MRFKTFLMMGCSIYALTQMLNLHLEYEARRQLDKMLAEHAP